MSLISFAAAIFFLVKYLITDGAKGDFTPEVIPYAILAGAFYCTASFLTFLAVKYGPFAISMLIISYSIVITSGYGIIFLGEPAGVLNYVAYALIAVSLFLVRPKSSEADREKAKKISFKWVICVAVSLFASAAYGIVLREQQLHFNNTVTSECMIIAMSFSAIALLAIGLKSAGRGALKIIKTSAPYAAVAGTCNATTNTLSLILYTMMPISVSAPTRSICGTALNFAFSYFILKEKFLPRQVIGIMLGAGAVVMLNIV